MDALDAAMLQLNSTWNHTHEANLSWIDCSEGYVSDNELLTSLYFRTLVYCMYISIFVVAMLGNGVVCYIVVSSPRMRTVTNYFIANLALGDILMSLFCVPFSFVSILLLAYWPFGVMLCHLVNYSQTVSVLVSAYTLVAISIDRYIAIMWPLRPRITKRYAKLIICVIWSIALITALPIPIVSRLQQPDGWHQYCGKFICQETWPSPEQNYYYTLCLLTLQFVIPLAVLVFTYTKIAIAVWGKRPPGEAENSRDRRMEKAKRKMVKMMVMVVIVFTMCWLPFNTLLMSLPADHSWDTWSLLPYLWFAFHWLAMSHSCYNPVIYCYMNTRFRSGFVQIWHWFAYRRCGLMVCCCCWCASANGAGGPGGRGGSSGGANGNRMMRGRGGGCGRDCDSNFTMTGHDGLPLQRINTTTTFISTRNNTRNSSLMMKSNANDSVMR